MSDNGKKTAAKTAMVPQKHGGALLPGGVPGNKGGPGRPSNELRGSLREILDVGLPHLKDFATGKKDAKPADQLKAIDIAARYGLPKEPYDEDLIFDLMDATIAVLPDDPELVTRIKKAWVPILAAKMGGG